MSLCNITLHTHTQPSHIPNPVCRPALYSSLWIGSGMRLLSTLVPSPSHALLSSLSSSSLLHISSLPALPSRHLVFFEPPLYLRYRKIRTTSMRANRTQMMMPIMIPTTVPATELSPPEDGSRAASPSQERE